MSDAHDAEAVVGALRANYDRLSNGDRAVLRRCKDADEVLLEGAFWRCVDRLPADDRRSITWLGQLILLFGSAEQRRATQPAFQFGRYLAGHGIKDVRVRQLLRCRDHEELTQRIGRLLRHAGTPVDWGVLGRDLRYFFTNDRTRRRWAQEYFTASSEET